MFPFRIVRSIDTAMIREIDSVTGPLNVDLKGALLKNRSRRFLNPGSRCVDTFQCRDAAQIQKDTFILADRGLLKQ